MREYSLTMTVALTHVTELSVVDQHQIQKQTVCGVRSLAHQNYAFVHPHHFDQKSNENKQNTSETEIVTCL